MAKRTGRQPDAQDALAARFRGVERFALRVPAAKSAAEPFIDGLYIPAQVAPRLTAMGFTVMRSRTRGFTSLR